MTRATKKKATYQDVVDAPEHVVAEILDGELYLSPRPAGPHGGAASSLGYLLGPPFQLRINGPGGWIIVDEPELHLGRPRATNGARRRPRKHGPTWGGPIVVPDLAGWRIERLPAIPRDAYFTVPPDWVCEMLSRSTEATDRAKKLPIYARHGVRYAWLISEVRRTLEVMRLQDGKWFIVGVHEGDIRVRAEPFDAIELDLSMLWRHITPPPPKGSRAAERGEEYDYISGW